MERVTIEEIKRRMEVQDIIRYMEEIMFTQYGHVRRANNTRWIAKVRAPWIEEKEEGLVDAGEKR